MYTCKCKIEVFFDDLKITEILGSDLTISATPNLIGENKVQALNMGLDNLSNYSCFVNKA